MYSFILIVLIMLPPTSAVNMAHAVNRFVVQTDRGYINEERCQIAMEDMFYYISSRVPLATVFVARRDCIKSIDG